MFNGSVMNQLTKEQIVAEEAMVWLEQNPNRYTRFGWHTGVNHSYPGVVEMLFDGLDPNEKMPLGVRKLTDTPTYAAARLGIKFPLPMHWFNFHHSLQDLRQYVDAFTGKISSHKTYGVVQAICQRPNLSEDLKYSFARSSSACRESIADRDDLPEDLIRELSNDDDFMVRMCIAGNPNLPQDLVTRMAHDSLFHVREKIARRPDLTSQALDILIVDSNHMVLRAIAARTDLNEKLLIELAQSGNQKVLQSLSYNKTIPLEAAIILRDERIRIHRDVFLSLVKRYPDIDPNVLKKLDPTPNTYR